ncbi:MAG TPA: alpha/beta fold hydrolase [Pyrinomonadaceae bacterium]
MQILRSLLLLLLLAYSANAFADELKRRGTLGVKFAPMPEAVKTQPGLVAGQGIYIADVQPGGSLQTADVKAGDVIVKIENAEVENANQLAVLMQKYYGGDKFQMTVLRDGKTLVKTIVLQARPFETSPDFDIVYDSIAVDGAKRRVIVTKPKTVGKSPAVLLVGGIGCYSVDNLSPNHSYRQILYPLTLKGFTTMRVEKSGMGDSEGEPCQSPQVDFQIELKGYAAGLKKLKGYEFVDAEQIFIFGHSIGGLSAPLVAADNPVKGIIVAETLGTNWFEYSFDNLRRQTLLKGTPFDETEKSLQTYGTCAHRFYIEKQTPEQIEKAAPQCVGYLNAPASYTYMQQLADINLAATWKKIKSPVLIVYGTSDYLTDAEEGEYLTNMINSFQPGKAEFVKINGMDHWFWRAASQRASQERSLGKQPPGEFHTGFLDEMQRWLNGISKKEVGK